MVRQVRMSFHLICKLIKRFEMYPKVVTIDDKAS